jgi:hypothetical protein
MGEIPFLENVSEFTKSEISEFESPKKSAISLVHRLSFK